MALNGLADGYARVRTMSSSNALPDNRSQGMISTLASVRPKSPQMWHLETFSSGLTQLLVSDSWVPLPRGLVGGHPGDGGHRHRVISYSDWLVFHLVALFANFDEHFKLVLFFVWFELTLSWIWFEFQIPSQKRFSLLLSCHKTHIICNAYTFVAQMMAEKALKAETGPFKLSSIIDSIDCMSNNWWLDFQEGKSLNSSPKFTDI